VSAEQERLGPGQEGDWHRWGPYLGDDGLAGFCDAERRLCLSLALWNGRDPILKERALGLAEAPGLRGADAREYWWYLDAIPSHAWNRWRYHYPQAAGSGRYWITEVHYAKAGPDDLLMAISATNAGPVTETLHVLPTCWFRNTWSRAAGTPRPAMVAASGASVRIGHPVLGPLELIADRGPDGAAPAVLFCENETNTGRFGTEPITPYPEDGINDYVVHGAPTVNPERTGTKCAFWYEVTVPPGETAELRLRLRPAARDGVPAFGREFGQVMVARWAEADEFYAELTRREASAEEAMVLRQAFAARLCGKQSVPGFSRIAPRERP
jgi:hypothetical protein